mgnify:FL=1
MNPKDNWYEKEKLVKNDVIYEAKFLVKTVHKKIAHIKKKKKNPELLFCVH